MAYCLVYMDFVSFLFTQPDMMSVALCCGHAPDFFFCRKDSTGVIQRHGNRECYASGAKIV